jgi:lipid II:glycine glycyltransferase (peptidoglycan interpeptide bridge formation enzyme)
VRLRERQERTEQELERRQETIIELKEDSNNARTERTRLEIQMADTERQYSEKYEDIFMYCVLYIYVYSTINIFIVISWAVL